jgi:hypothetical protein
VTDRPSRIWKELPPDVRLTASTAFWKNDESNDAALQHAEAIMAIAKRLNFRPKSAQALPEERRARLLAQMSDVSDAVATRALIAYHFETQRPLMAAFLDALGVAHDNGLITAESVTPPEAAAISDAAGRVRQAFPGDAVRLYLRTLKALDADTWANLNVDDVSGPGRVPGV